MTVNPLRAQQVEFTIPYYREAVTLLFPADSPYTGTADITGKGATIAILENPTAVVMVQNGVPDAEVTTFDSLPTRSWRSIPAGSKRPPSTFRRPSI